MGDIESTRDTYMRCLGVIEGADMQTSQTADTLVEKALTYSEFR